MLLRIKLARHSFYVCVLKPACSLEKSFSISRLILLSKTLSNTFYVTLSKDIGLQFLASSALFPDFSTASMFASFQLGEIFLFSIISENSFYNQSIALLPRFLRKSDRMPSGSADFPLLVFFKSISIS